MHRTRNACGVGHLSSDPGEDYAAFACDEADSWASLTLETQLSQATTPATSPPTSSELRDQDHQEHRELRELRNLETLLSQATTPASTPPKSASTVRTELGTFSALAKVSARSVALKCSPRAVNDLARFRGSDHRDLALFPDTPERLPKGAATSVTLATVLTKLHIRRMRLPSDRLKAIMYQLVRALAHAAGFGVCHHDVRPANIMITLRTSPVMAQMTGWDAGPSTSSSLYSAPELFLSPEFVIMEHKKADVWSLGMLFVEAARGKPLVETDSKRPLDPHLTIAGMMVSLGTPCETALRALDPHAPPGPALRRIVRKPWRHLLKESAFDSDKMRWQLLDAMLDWNPETRESAVSLLCFPYFSASHTETGKSSSATSLRLTDAELRGIISLAFTAHASSGADSTEPEVSSPQSPTRDRPASKRGLHGGIRLVLIEEDSEGERDSSPSSSSRPSNLGASQAHSAAAPRFHRARCVSRCCSIWKQAASALDN
jgi:hypothetical protein